MYDVAIIGGGMVGMSMALALASTPFKICLLEASPTKPSKTAKPLVLSEASRRFYETLGLWPSLKPYIVPIEAVHASEKGQWGVARFNAVEQKLPAFGYVIESELLEEKLRESLNIEIINETITTAEQLKNLRAKLIIGADGTFSQVRQLLNLGEEEQDFKETALVGTLKTNSHKKTAFERFLPEGALAVLPFYENASAFIYTVPNKNIKKLQSLTEQDFLKHLQEQLGYYAGQVESVTQTGAYPIKQVLAKKWSEGNVLLLGNAAHTLHPIAAQGFNLALRDIGALVKCIQKDPALTLEWLPEYVKARQHQQAHILRFIKALLAIKWGRGVALFLFDSLPVKYPFLSFAMGLHDVQL